MKFPPLTPSRVASALLAAGLIALIWHWGPARQVRLHQRHFLAAVENRNWQKAGEFVAANYRDQWRQDRPTLLRRLPEVFSDFVVLGVLEENLRVSWTNDGAGIAASTIRIVGRGGPIAQAVIAKSAELTPPFSLTWRRQSWRPWDWRLTAASQPALDPPANVDEGAGLEEWRPTR